jgi:hypothetical protein
MSERKPADEWTVYGVALRYPNSKSGPSITRRFRTEDEAWEYTMTCRLNCTALQAVLVHTTYRQGKGHYKWRPVNTVMLRFGEGKGWWE